MMLSFGWEISTIGCPLHCLLKRLFIFATQVNMQACFNLIRSEGLFQYLSTCLFSCENNRRKERRSMDSKKSLHPSNRPISSTSARANGIQGLLLLLCLLMLVVSVRKGGYLLGAIEFYTGYETRMSRLSRRTTPAWTP